MKHILLAASALSLLVGAGAAAAQPGHDRGPPGHMAPGHMGPGPGGPGGMHHDWRRGGRIDAGDWRRGRVVSNYSRYHLRRPPRGYQWRDVDGNYVLAAVAGGVIADILAH